jgi:hypothetical protein
MTATVPHPTCFHFRAFLESLRLLLLSRRTYEYEYGRTVVG